MFNIPDHSFYDVYYNDFPALMFQINVRNFLIRFTTLL